MNWSGAIPCQYRWLGSKLMPNDGRCLMVSRVRMVVQESNAISVGWTSSANVMPFCSYTSRIGFHRSANCLYPASIHSSDTGGKEYQPSQIEEPVNPVTTETPSRCATTAVFFIWSTAHALIFSGLSLIHISEPTRLGMSSYAVFCLKKRK